MLHFQKAVKISVLLLGILPLFDSAFADDKKQPTEARYVAYASEAHSREDFPRSLLMVRPIADDSRATQSSVQNCFWNSDPKVSHEILKVLESHFNAEETNPWTSQVKLTPPHSLTPNQIVGFSLDYQRPDFQCKVVTRGPLPRPAVDIAIENSEGGVSVSSEGGEVFLVAGKVKIPLSFDPKTQFFIGASTNTSAEHQVKATLSRQIATNRFGKIEYRLELNYGANPSQKGQSGGGAASFLWQR